MGREIIYNKVINIQLEMSYFETLYRYIGKSKKAFK